MAREWAAKLEEVKEAVKEAETSVRALEAEKKRVPRIRQQTSESRIYGFIHFTEREAREKALIPAMRVFGVKIRDCLCRTGGGIVGE